MRKHLRRLTVSYWPAEGFTIHVTHADLGDHETAALVAVVRCEDTSEAVYRAARKQTAAILKALRGHVVRVSGETLQWVDAPWVKYYAAQA